MESRRVFSWLMCFFASFDSKDAKKNETIFQAQPIQNDVGKAGCL